MEINKMKKGRGGLKKRKKEKLCLGQKRKVNIYLVSVS